MADKKRVFISFASEDLKFVRGVRLMNDNPDLDLEFYDESIKVPIDSDDANYIKSQIRPQIVRSSCIVCLIGKETHNSSWVDWELEVAHNEDKSIIVMAVKDINEATLPHMVSELGLTFHAWDYEVLAKLIDQV